MQKARTCRSISSIETWNYKVECLANRVHKAEACFHSKGRDFGDQNQQRCTSRLVTSLQTQFDQQIRRRTWQHLKAGPNHISKRLFGGIKASGPHMAWDSNRVEIRKWFHRHYETVVEPKESLFRISIRRGCKLTAQSRSFPRFSDESLMRTSFCAVITIRSLIFFREFHGPAASFRWDPSNLMF